MKRILASACLVHACSIALADGTNPLLDRELVKSLPEAEYLNAMRTENINERDEEGSTPLHYAAQVGTSEAVTALLTAGANIHARNVAGITPLHWAAANRSYRTVMTLITAGANAEAKNQHVNTPFDYASYNEKLRGSNACWMLNDAQYE